MLYGKRMYNKLAMFMHMIYNVVPLRDSVEKVRRLENLSQVKVASLWEGRKNR